MVPVFGPEKTELNLLDHLTLFGYGSLQSLTIVLKASGNLKKEKEKIGFLFGSIQFLFVLKETVRIMSN
jgi:hypothetical protein